MTIAATKNAWNWAKITGLCAVAGVGISLYNVQVNNHRETMKAFDDLKSTVTSNNQQIQDHEKADEQIHAGFGDHIERLEGEIFALAGNKTVQITNNYRKNKH